MASFASPLLWQVRFLVTHLAKRNFKSSVAELNQVRAPRWPRRDGGGAE